jgi:hypothetical protein
MIDQLAPTALSQFIRLDACQRFLYFTLHPNIADEMRQRYGVRPRPLSPLLKQAGERFEAEVTSALRADHELIDLASGEVSATVEALRKVGRTPVILAQAALDGTIGSWRSAGRADLIEAIRDKRGRLHVLIADVKASREERLEHRVQVATYALLLTDLCRREGLPLIRIVGAVVHRTPTGPFTTLHDPALHFELGPYQTLVLDLIAKDDGVLNRVAQATLEELPFALSALCDGCPFNPICLPHAAERADLALVTDVSRATRSALHAHEIRELRTLAALKEPDAAGILQPVPAQADRIALLLRDPVIAPQLDQLIARARAVLRRLDPTMRAPSRLPDFQSSPLPDPAAHPHLLQIFLDVQADDVTGDLYLASALVHGTAGERMVTRMSDAPPTAENEAELLRDWAATLEAVLRELATDDAPPLHVLVYDRRAQRIALEACARHEQQHALLGVLVAWLQERPQIERATCARIRDVIGQQRNLRLTCDSLYAVATEVWDEHNQRFSWKTPEHDFTRLFRGGLFDNLQRFVRMEDGLHAASPLAQESFSLEAASRFSSQIPSEYAYAVWNGAPNKPGRAELLAFAEHRLRALAHLAKAARRQRHLDVPLLPLDQLPTAAGPRDLRSALIEFLELEYTAALADLLAHVRLPIARRVLTGRTALLEAIAVDPKSDPPIARFRFASLTGGGSVPPRFKVGDWAVLNEAVDGLSPWEIIRGRLVIISAVDEETLEVELTSLSSAGRFKFHHDSKLQVQVRCRYTLDEMADDLLADKVRAALDHLDTNPLARWLQASQTATPTTLDEAMLAEAAADLIALHAPAVPTEAQRQVIATGLQIPLRLVQGPPGSGKSRTLGLAVVARLLAAAMQGQRLRVAVTAKTHSAVQVALDSIAKAWRQWCAVPDQAPLLPLADLPIVKLGGSSIAPRASGVRWADPRKGAKDLRALIGGAVVMGGTPGGLSALLETTQRKARWDGLFDLLLIDEASQMSLPEGLLAASALHERGQMMVVGDHRQMPPIITHAWDETAGSLAAWSPERSLFKWLLDAAAPCVALDESFRLHRDHARFLNQAIYHADGIMFHSRRTDLLPPRTFPDAFIDAALRWDVPLVVIEHNERDSRQSNPLEALLVADLVRACLELGLDGRDGIGVVVPHRAQKAALRAQLPELARSDSIDTVERFQGGERDVIIVACTASDPNYVSAEAEFLLDPQRLNVALSRARKKLIVVAATSVFGALPVALPIFERAALWKQLHSYAAPHPLWQGSRYAYRMRVMGPAASAG